MGKMKKNDDLFQIVQFFEIVLVLLVIYVIAISEPFFLDMHVFCSTIGVSISYRRYASVGKIIYNLCSASNLRNIF